MFDPHSGSALRAERSAGSRSVSVRQPLPSAAARLSVVSLLHAGRRRRPNRLVHRHLQRHLLEHLAHRHLWHAQEQKSDSDEKSFIFRAPCTQDTSEGSCYLLEVKFLEHGDADLVVQSNFCLKLFHPKFCDSWRKTNTPTFRTRPTSVTSIRNTRFIYHRFRIYVTLLHVYRHLKPVKNLLFSYFTSLRLC